MVEETRLTGTGRDCHNRRAGALGTGNSDNVSGVLLQVYIDTEIWGVKWFLSN